MAVTALLPGSLPTVPLPDVPALVPAAVGTQARIPDVVVFSSAPFRLLADLASAGLQQLAALLPAIEQAAVERDAVPLGHLAKAAGAAARQIAEGHVALLAAGPDRIAAALRQAPVVHASATGGAAQLLRTLARSIGATPEPYAEARTSESLRTMARQLGEATFHPLTPDRAPEELDPAQQWRGEADRLLRGTVDALDQAGDQLRPQPGSPAGAPTGWALAEIMAAQAQIAQAATRLGETAAARPRPARSAGAWPALRLPAPSSTTVGLFGMLLVLAAMWVATGLWSLAAGAVAVAASLFWAWRFCRAAEGFMKAH